MEVKKSERVNIKFELCQYVGDVRGLGIRININKIIVKVI